MASSLTSNKVSGKSLRRRRLKFVHLRLQGTYLQWRWDLVNAGIQTEPPMTYAQWLHSRERRLMEAQR